MTCKKFIHLIVILFFTHPAWADSEQTFDIKELRETGKISSLENILDKLSAYKITRLLEIKIKKDTSHPVNQRFIYEIEYINDKGIVLEIEVDALTAHVLNIEREH